MVFPPAPYPGEPMERLLRSAAPAATSTGTTTAPVAITPQTTAAPPSSGFEDLLAQQKMNLLQNLGQPSGWGQVGRGFDLLAAGAMGGEQFLNQRNAQAQQDIQRQNILQAFVGNEQSTQAQAARLAYEQHKAAGDEFTTWIGQVTMEDPRALTNLLLDSSPVFQALEQKLGISEDEMPLPYKKRVVEAIINSNPERYSAAQEPEIVAKVVDGSEIGGDPGKKYEVQGYIDRQTGEFVQTDINTLGPMVSIGDIGASEEQQSINWANQQDTTFKAASAQYENAQKAAPTIALLKESLKSNAFETGAFGETALFLSQLVEALGANPGDFPGLGDPSIGENIQAAADQLAIQNVGELSRVTNMSIELTRNAGPRLLRTVRGNKLIVDLMEQKNNRDIARAVFASEYVTNHGYVGGPQGSLIGALQKWDKENPAWTKEDTKKVHEIARSRGPTIGEAVGNATLRIPKYAAEADRMTDEEVINLIRNIPDATWENMDSNIKEKIQQRYLKAIEK